MRSEKEIKAKKAELLSLLIEKHNKIHLVLVVMIPQLK
jgi:hypothetical protein